MSRRRVRHLLRRWWWLAALLLALLLAALLLSPGDRSLMVGWIEGRGVGDWQRIRDSGQLRVAMDPSYPPFEWVDESGERYGYDVSLAEALGERWGVEVQYADVHFDGLYDALLAKKCDLIISALPHDRLLTQDVLYSQSYYNAGLVLVVPEGDEDIQGLEDLAGRRVGVELGSEGHHLVRQWQRDRQLETELVPLRDGPEALMADLREGSLDAAICDAVAAATYGGEGLRRVSPMLTDEPYVIAARPQAHGLIDQVDVALEAWRDSGRLAEWEERWFDEAATLP